MPDRWAVANGNYSAGSTWNGGTVPTAADDVYSNGFIVTLNQDVVALSLRNTAGSVAVAGGYFQATTTRTVTANIFSGATTCLFPSVNTPNIFTLNGNVQSGTAQACITCSGNGSVIINGTVTAGSGNSTGANGVATTFASVTINGDVNGGTGTNTYGLIVFTGGTNVTLIVNGMAKAGSGAGSSAIRNQSTNTITVTNAEGGSGNSAHGCDNISTGRINVSQDAKGGPGTIARGVNNASTGTVNVTGFAIGADNTGGVGVFNASTGLCTIGGARFGLQGWPPYVGIVRFNDLDAAQMRIVRADLASRDLRSGAFIPNYSMAGGFPE